MSVVAVIITAIITAVSLLVVTAIIMTISVIIAIVRSVVAVVTLISLTIAVVVTTIVVLFVIAASFGLLWFWRDAEGALLLFTLLHGVLGVTVELTLAVQRAVEVPFEEGGPSWSIGRVDLARPPVP
jgi:hypothetical protein